MCGIAGYLGNTRLDEIRINQIFSVMANRGPDAQDCYIDCVGDAQLHLFHTRLSIIDLDLRANQPFTIGECVLAFNGEIYNYLELRRKLESKGVCFQTDSDTEVLLQCYLHYGEQCVEFFEGMWAFAILDKRKHTLLLSRDRFAEKPLYYMQTESGFYFASEVKFIKAMLGSPLPINEQQLYRYLVNGYKSLYKQNETFYADVKELPYATNMIIDIDNQGFSQHRYWKPTFHINQNMTRLQAVEGFKDCFLESMRLRLRSDVPMAFCLSGGVDSSAIVSVAAKVFNYDVHTFSIIDSDERYNEYDNIKATIDDLKCKNTIINIPKITSFERLEKLIKYHDSPVATISYYIHSFLSEKIHQEGYKVVFSGTAADEMVTGYYDHYNLHLYEMRHHKNYQKYLRAWQLGTGRIVRNPHLKNPELYFQQPEFREHIYLNNTVFAEFLNCDFHEEFNEVEYTESLLRNRMLNELFHEAIPVILHEDDLNSMYYSIENRSPYLDKNLFDFSYSIPNEHLINDGYAKFVLREAMRGILNDKVRLDGHKKGFNASILSLFNFEDNAFQDRLLEKSPIFEYIKRDKVEKFLKSDLTSNSMSKFMFSFINTKIFLEQN
jgi:asparagine synthase (glutamine-hydrolysing)